MKLEGFLLFIAMSVIVETLTRVITTLPYFKQESDLKSYLKFIISLSFAQLISISFVYLSKNGMILTYFGITSFAYEDAILSGIMIAGGSNLLHEVFQTVISFKEKVQAQTERAELLLEKTKRELNVQ